jgi:hypothetical protein
METSRPEQRTLNQSRIEEFHHDLFVETQIEHFNEICTPRLREDGVVVDMGGGCGFFAAALARSTGLATRVVDMDPASVAKARALGVDAQQGDALAPPKRGDESSVCFNLILHHLVGASGAQTHQLQRAALRAWQQTPCVLFVHEYIYESYLVRGLSGWAIYTITSSKLLSRLGQLVSRLVPSLRANTFGVGVRFRSADEWRRMFESEGWMVAATRRGEEERVSLARRLLLIKSCRRDSFLLTSERA